MITYANCKPTKTTKYHFFPFSFLHLTQIMRKKLILTQTQNTLLPGPLYLLISNFHDLSKPLFALTKPRKYKTKKQTKTKSKMKRASREDMAAAASANAMSPGQVPAARADQHSTLMEDPDVWRPT